MEGLKSTHQYKPEISGAIPVNLSGLLEEYPKLGVELKFQHREASLVKLAIVDQIMYGAQAIISETLSDLDLIRKRYV